MMSGLELRRIRETLGISVDEFAIELGFGGNRQGNRRTIHRFETEQRDIPYSVGKLAWLLSLRPGDLPQWPEHLVPVQLLEEGEIDG